MQRYFRNNMQGPLSDPKEGWTKVLKIRLDIKPNKVLVQRFNGLIGLTEVQLEYNKIIINF